MIYLNSNRFVLRDVNKKNITESDKSTVFKLIHDKFGVSSDYRIFMINNVYESYTLIIDSITRAFSTVKRKPNVITNTMEDPNLINILNDFVKSGAITVTYITPMISGAINPHDIEKAITAKTCLVVCGSVNCATGAINDTAAIGALAHKRKIPLFCDHTYAISTPLNPTKNSIDVATFDLDFPGLSFLIIKNDLLTGYKLERYAVRFVEEVEKHNSTDPYIYGLAKYIITTIYKNRQAKNKRLAGIKKQILDATGAMRYEDLIKESQEADGKKPDTNRVVVFGGENTSPHIVALLCEPKLPKNLILCSTPLSVFKYIGITDKWIKKIVIIGISDDTTQKDINKLLKHI